MKPLLVALFCLPGLLLAQEKNRFNLSETPAKPRFKVTDISWPQKPGEAEICLWHDDKLAALSLGVDDNNAGDIDWWKEQADLHKFRMTWFVITGRVDANRSTGYWKQFNELQSLGHDIQSHSVTHLHMMDADWGTPAWDYKKATAAANSAGQPAAAEEGEGGAGNKGAAAGTTASGTAVPAAKPNRYRMTAADMTLPPEKVGPGILWEYKESKAQIEAHLPDKVCSVLAYPGGAFTKFNDRTVAAQVFRTARGARGTQNMANQIDYLSTNAQSNWSFETDKYGWGNPTNIVDPKLYNGRYYRGWAVLFQHQANKELMAKTFEFMDKYRDQLWIGLYAQVGQYGQERDTATLKVESVQPDKITLNLTDEMDDSYFNYPLTVKVRLPDDWKSAKATQAGKTAEVKYVTHENAPYALIQVVPDAGLVTVTKG